MDVKEESVKKIELHIILEVYEKIPLECSYMNQSVVQIYKLN